MKTLTVEAINKIEVLVYGLLEQCEEQGLTISQVKAIPQILQIHIDDNIALNNNQNVFRLLKHQDDNDVN